MGRSSRCWASSWRSLVEDGSDREWRRVGSGLMLLLAGSLHSDTLARCRQGRGPSKCPLEHHLVAESSAQVRT